MTWFQVYSVFWIHGLEACRIQSSLFHKNMLVYRCALFAVAHLTSTLATRSPEWCLSVTLYQLPTCHRHPLCFTPLCVPSPCSHLALSSLWGLFLSFSCCLPDSPALCRFIFPFLHSFSFVAHTFLFLLALFKTLLPYPSVPTAVLILAFPSYSSAHD